MTQATVKGALVALSLCTTLLVTVSFASSPAGPTDVDLEPASEVSPEANGRTAMESSAEPSLAELRARLLGPGGGGFVVYAAGSCSATADCADGSTVSCSSRSSSGTCSFQDSVCSPTHIRGFAECNGFKRWCPMDECDPEIPDCTILNNGECMYEWNPTLGCCELTTQQPVGGPFCLEAC